MNYIGGNMKIKKDYIELFILSAITILFIVFSFDAKNGAKNGLTLAEGVIVPSLLPLLIIFNLVLKTGAGSIIEKIFSPITEKIFRLPKSTSSAIIFGLIGGYPTGAILTDNLYNNGDIDKETAKRLLRFNVNGGVAFIITAVGTVVLKSEKAGIILFVSTTISSLIIAFLSSFRYEKIKCSDTSYNSMPIGEALNESVEISIKSVLNISAYVIMFSAVNEIAKLPSFIMPFIEITNGIVNNHKSFSIPEIAFLLAFAGFCIHFQLLTIIKKVKMKYYDFLFWRIAHSVLSYFVCKVILYFFPIQLAVFSNVTEIVSEVSYINPTLSILMILGCAVIIFDIEGKKKKC